MSDYDDKKVSPGNGHTFHEGDWISIDGSTGNIYDGRSHRRPPPAANFGRFMGWADKFRRLHVRTNADTPRDASRPLIGRRGHRPVPYRAYVLR